MKLLELECAWHMGDNFINFMFFTKIKNYIEENDIFINYYCYEEYHKNLHDFNPSNNIKIFPLLLPYKKKYYECWQGGRTASLTPSHLKTYVEDQMIFMYNLFIKDLEFNIIIDDKWYYESPMIFGWYNELPDNYKNIDILIVNSSPRSGQYSYHKDIWDRDIIELSHTHKGKIATTQFVSDNIISLDKLSLKDITAISTNVNYIIGINTGPLLPLFNTYTLDRVKKIHIFGGNFKHPKAVCHSNMSSIKTCVLD